MYAASKSAIHGITKSLAGFSEEKDYICINTVAPALIASTSMSSSVTGAKLKDYELKGKVTTLDKVNSAIIDLLDDTSGRT